MTLSSKMNARLLKLILPATFFLIIVFDLISNNFYEQSHHIAFSEAYPVSDRIRSLTD